MKLSQYHPSSKMSHCTKARLRGVILLTIVLTSLAGGNFALAADAANRQQAIEIALQQNGGAGKVLGVRTVKDKNGHTVYAVKILSDGRVRVIRINQSR